MTQTHPLSNREQEVLKLLLQGKSNKLIGLVLGISDRTVEFHLKNIYAKFQVSSRMELILRLLNATGGVEIEKLGSSTVDNSEESAENRDTLKLWAGWKASFKNAISMIGRKLEMKNILNSTHVLAGLIAAFLTGFLWVILLSNLGHMTPDSINPWIIPLVVTLAMIGLAIGLVGKRNGNSPGKVFFSTLFGAGFGAMTMIPIMGFVIYPLAKFTEGLGLINRSAISTDVTTLLVIFGLFGLWLMVGIASGIVILFVSINAPKHVSIQKPATKPVV